MIKAEELQIGDLVFCTYKHQYYKVAEIKTVADEELKLKVYDENTPLVFQMKYFEPIPLTDEILEKNFEKKEHGYQVCQCWKIWSNPNYGYILATLVVDEFGGGSYEPCLPCRYVHELQHFLKLKHEEKEITL